MPSFNWRLALQSGYTPEEIQAHLDSPRFSARGLSDEALIQRQLGGKPMLPYSYGPDLDMPPPAAAPPPLMSGPPASVPGSVPQTWEPRNMSLNEAQALLNEQGIQPVLTPPMSLKDLAMEPIYSFLADAELPPALLQTVRYKRPGVSALARQAAELYHGTPRVDPIGSKATVFHATDPEYLPHILKAGEIVPNPQELSQRGFRSWEDFRRLKNLDNDAPVSQELIDKAITIAKEQGIDPNRISNRLYNTDPAAAGHNFERFLSGVFGADQAQPVLAQLGYKGPYNQRIEGLGGVSVSRVPRVASKGTKAVSFVVDPEKMPPARPFAEPSYRKTIPPDKPTWPGLPNPKFEFEDRTYNTAIPTSAVREMWVDKSALPGYIPPTADMTREFYPGQLQKMQAIQQSALQPLRDLATQYGIPLREFETGREMHRGRLSDLAKKKRK